MTVHEAPGLDSIKAEHGISEEFAGCHTALVDGYVVEGHVPAADIKRMLEERPDVIGLVVPGMPIGSPGMESADRPAEPYDVLALVTASTVVHLAHDLRHVAADQNQ